jgi:pimeloyl-ACP methyl ester carboxylesterase
MRHKYIVAIFLALTLFTACQKEDFSKSGLADDHFFLQSGGQNMPVTVAGNIDSDKLVIILHGGPGGMSTIYRDNCVKNNVEKEFALVYWDQRFAGGSQGNGGPSEISDFKDDLRQLIQLLKLKYGQVKKIYLFGHSWGGFLAPCFLLDKENQQMVDGWIQVDGAHNYLLNDSLSQQKLIFYGKREVAANNNVSKWEPIIEFCVSNSFSIRENADKMNRFAGQAEGLIQEVAAPSNNQSILSIIMTNHIPYTSCMANLGASVLLDIDCQTYDEPIRENLHEITVPALMLWGKYDFICPSGLMDELVENISSTDIETKLFEKSGHSPMDNEPDLFWKTVVDWVNTH